MQFSPNELAQRGSNYLYALGRLAPGATLQSAHAELVRLFDGIVAANPELRGEQVRALSLVGEGVRTVRKPLMLLFGAVCMVLLIAATNVASLLLARSVHRRRELAIRSALGGNRHQLMRPVLSESLVMTAIGLLLGLGLAWGGVRTIGSLAAARLPQLAGLSVDCPRDRVRHRARGAGGARVRRPAGVAKCGRRSAGRASRRARRRDEPGSPSRARVARRGRSRAVAHAADRRGARPQRVLAAALERPRVRPEPDPHAAGDRSRPTAIPTATP